MNEEVKERNFSEVEEQRRRKAVEDVQRELRKIRNYTPKVGIFGDTGVGKSSLCNALFGQDVAEVSDVEACTRNPQEIVIGNQEGGGIVLIDVPGVGEDPARHQEYINLYKSLVPQLDLVLWAIKADDRKYLSSINAYQEVLAPTLEKCPVVFVITQVDKIEPYKEWDDAKHMPGQNQESSINRKIIDVSCKFNVPANRIIAVSSNESYNLKSLVNVVVDVLPNEKKYAFTREAKEENVSEEAVEKAERGAFDYLKEKLGNAWDYVKDDVVDAAVQAVKKHGPALMKKALNWLKSW